MDPTSLYLHIPFCRHRCSYCDFNTYARMDHLIPEYVEALCQELVSVAGHIDIPVPVPTIYFGGGTPSLLGLDQIRILLETIRRKFNLSELSEVSLEANPGTLSQEYLHGIRKLGINRLSLGIQSTFPDELAMLDRKHLFLDGTKSVEMARKSGFDNINLDLIFGIPNQTVAGWLENLTRCVELNPEHLSLYALTIEPRTLLGKNIAKGLIAECDPDLSADMYEAAGDLLDRLGYQQYEISNWTRVDPGGLTYSCAHNLQYWRNQPYLGIGAGAHGYFQNVRYANSNNPNHYIQRILHNRHPGDAIAPMTENHEVRAITPSAENRQGGAIAPMTENHEVQAIIRASGSIRDNAITPAAESYEIIDKNAEMQETMLTGLRLVREGVSCLKFRQRFHQELDDVFSNEIETLIRKGLLERVKIDKELIRLTKRGRFISNQVFMHFV